MADNENVLSHSIYELEKCSLHENGVEFGQKLIGNGKNKCSAGKTSALLRGDASQINRCYVVAHCGGGYKISKWGLKI